jgi:hypothetical protein
MGCVHGSLSFMGLYEKLTDRFHDSNNFIVLSANFQDNFSVGGEKHGGTQIKRS